MAKVVDLLRHTDSDGDLLTPQGVSAAMEIGFRDDEGYDLVVSSGAQRATQTAACFLAANGLPVPGGVIVDERFRSDVEDRWKDAYRRAGAGDIESFRAADPDLVEKESMLLADALRELFGRLPEGGRALVVGHSPMQEAAAWGLTGVAVEPLAKGAAVRVSEEDGSFRVEELGG